MSETDPRETSDLAGRLAALRLVVIALLLGTATMTMVAAFTAGRMAGPPLPDESVVYGFLGVGFLCVIGNLLFFRAVLERGRPASTFAGYGSRTIYAVAAAEAPAVVLILGYVVTHNVLVLAPLPVLLGMIAVQLPTAEKFARWRERQSDSPYTSGESADSSDRERP